jgi:hypothetical protein
MSFWKQIFPKREANPPTSMIGCAVAYALLLAIAIALLYLLGAVPRIPGSSRAAAPAPTAEQPKETSGSAQTPAP